MTKAEGRAVALYALLQLPDEACMHRGHRYTYARDPLKAPDEVKRLLAVAHVAWRMQEHAGGDHVVSVRRYALRIARRA